MTVREQLHKIKTDSLSISDKKIYDRLVSFSIWTPTELNHAKRIISISKQSKKEETTIKQNNKSHSDKQIEIKNNRIILNEDFRGDIIFKFRKIPGNYYCPINKNWSFTNNDYTIESLKSMGFKVPIVQSEQKKIDIPETGLYDFQKEDVQRIVDLNGRVLLASDMGTGKTSIVCTYIKINPDKLPVLIVCPASLKINWSREIEKWQVNKSVRIINGLNDTPEKTSDIYIINYDILYNYIDFFESLNLKMVVGDECHYVKGRHNRRSRALKYIAKGIEHIILISGTPITNRPAEFFTTLNLIAPEMFNSESKFLNEFCNYQKDTSGKGASNTFKLNEILTKSFMIRRLKKDVLKELPQKVRTVIPVEITNRGEYERAREDLIGYIRENQGKEAARRAMYAETLVRFEKMKQLAVQGKMSLVKEWIKDYTEENGKLVVFCTHTAVIEELEKEFKDICVKIDGSVSQTQRQKAVDQFQNNDEIKLFFGNLKAAGVGITLTAAASTLTLELDWIPASHFQGEDRILRIGQQADSVNAFYIVGVNTIEEDIAKIIDKKDTILTQIMDGKEVEEDNLLTELIKRYSE